MKNDDFRESASRHQELNHIFYFLLNISRQDLFRNFPSLLNGNCCGPVRIIWNLAKFQDFHRDRVSECLKSTPDLVNKILFWYFVLCCIRSSETEGGTVREVRNTQVSLVIAAVFLVSHSVRWVPNIWELRQAGNGVVRKYFRKYFNHFASQKIFQPFWFSGSAVALVGHLDQPGVPPSDGLQLLHQLLHLPGQTGLD